MCHPYFPWGAQVWLLVVFSWNRALVPSGASGVLLWSNMPLRAACADNFVLKRQLQSRFRVKFSCSRKQSHSFDGYPGLAAQTHVIKCALNIWMARLAAFCLWGCGVPADTWSYYLSNLFSDWMITHYQGCEYWVDVHFYLMCST